MKSSYHGGYKRKLTKDTQKDDSFSEEFKFAMVFKIVRMIHECTSDKSLEVCGQLQEKKKEDEDVEGGLQGKSLEGCLRQIREDASHVKSWGTGKSHSDAEFFLELGKQGFNGRIGICGNIQD